MPDRIKNKQKPEINEKQASRFKPAPPKLHNLIELVNLVPPESVLADVDDVLERVNECLQEKGIKDTPVRQEDGRIDYLINEKAAAELDNAVESLIVGLPSKFRDYIGQVSFLEDGLAAADRYRYVKESREKLKSIVWSASRSSRGHMTIEAFMKLSTGTYYVIDEEGLIQLKKDDFSEAVIGAEASRIRECEVCKRFFWAGRITMKGCSARCGDVLRKRRHRERRNEYEYRRYEKEKAAVSRTLKLSSKKKDK